MNRVCALVTDLFELPPDRRPTGSESRLYGQGLGVDSLAALQLVAAIEAEFDVAIPDAELTPSAFESVGSVVALVERLRRTR